MNPIAIAFAIAVPAAFVAGVAVHKYVISEAEVVMAHVTTAVTGAETRIRADISSLLGKVAAKV